MERIDKIISNNTLYSRSEVKKLIKSNKIKVNDIIIDKSEFKVDISKDIITIDGEKLKIKGNIYLVLNKPKGYISATEDKHMKTILDLVSKDYGDRNLFPIGRLDKDTTGLIILTDDGAFLHDIVSPKKEHRKIYKAVIDIPVNDEMITGFEEGVELNDGKCKPSKLEKLGEYEALITLTEGRYHQIKRMFGCFGAKVVELERIQIGNFVLPEELKLGEYRELSKSELDLIIKK